MNRPSNASIRRPSDRAGSKADGRPPAERDRLLQGIDLGHEVRRRTVSRIDPSSNSARTISVGRRPSAVAVGLGPVWVANADDGTVSPIDPRSNTVVKTIDIGNRPAGLAVEDGF